MLDAFVKIVLLHQKEDLVMVLTEGYVNINNNDIFYLYSSLLKLIAPPWEYPKGVLGAAVC